MGKYLKLFETDSERVGYEDSENYLEPYVSYVEGDNTVHYNKPQETRVIAVFNVTDTSNAIRIMGTSKASNFSEIEIDGVVQPSVVESYQFSTTGEHTVKYTLIDYTIIGGAVFSSCANLTSVTIPSSVNTISTWAFDSCSGLTSVTIPNSVTSIGYEAFYGCSGLTSIVCNATIAPTIQNSTFQNIKTNGTLTVPIGSSGYDVWMGTGNHYLGKYNWTKVEQ